MPKDSNINKKDKNKPKPGKGKPSARGKFKGGKGLPRDQQSKPGPQPKKRENIAKKVNEQAKKNGRKKANVLLPVIYVHPEKEADPEEMCQAEISYKDKMLAVQMGRLAEKGFNDTEIIKQLGISRSTFYDKINDNPYFAYKLYEKRGIAVQMATSALLQNVTGFEYIEEQMAGNGVVRPVMKRKLPETKAIEFFLTNRDPENWKRKVEQVHSAGAGMEAITFTLKKREG